MYVKRSKLSIFMKPVQENSKKTRNDIGRFTLESAVDDPK